MGAEAGPVQQRQAGDICYQLARRRVKHLNLRVRSDGTVAVSIPMRASVRQADAFVLAHRDWILTAVRRQQSRAAKPLPDRAAALEHFTELSRAVFPAFAGVLGGQMPAIKVRAMTAAGESATPPGVRSPLPWPSATSRRRPRNMWWSMSSVIFWCPTTARPSGPRWNG